MKTIKFKSNFTNKEVDAFCIKVLKKVDFEFCKINRAGNITLTALYGMFTYTFSKPKGDDTRVIIRATNNDPNCRSHYPLNMTTENRKRAWSVGATEAYAFENLDAAIKYFVPYLNNKTKNWK